MVEYFQQLVFLLSIWLYIYLNFGISRKFYNSYGRTLEFDENEFYYVRKL